MIYPNDNTDEAAVVGVASRNKLREMFNRGDKKELVLSTGAVSMPLSDADMVDPAWATAKKIGMVLSAISAPISGFHGYKRNQSVGWGVAWFVLGALFPVVTPTIAVAQGYGKRK